jgi:hypothetical protein
VGEHADNLARTGSRMKKTIVFAIGGALVWLASWFVPLMQPLFDFVDWLMK